MFIKYIRLHKELFLLTQHNAARPSPERPEPLPTRVIATQHLPATPATKPLKPLCQFLSVWETIPRISRWLLCIRARVTLHPSVQTQTNPFQWRGVVSNTDSKCPYPKTSYANCSEKERYNKSQRAGGTAVLSSRFLGCLREMVDSARF